MMKLNCACVIHGDLYSFDYVERLHAMLHRHLTLPFDFHVFTESDRSIPSYMTAHWLQPWPGVAGARRAWWYKLQLFNSSHDLGQILYLDLDTVIVNSLDWIKDLDINYFWSLRDFKYLWRPDWQGLNSSLMYWHTRRWTWIWQDFIQKDKMKIIKQYRGDQDYLASIIPLNQLKFVDLKQVKSWRWQAKDGGLDPTTRQYRRPGQGTAIDPHTSLLCFHGSPKPHEINDVVIQNHWRC